MTRSNNPLRSPYSDPPTSLSSKRGLRPTRDALCPAGRAAGFGRAHRARGQAGQNRQPTVHRLSQSRRGAARCRAAQCHPRRAARQARPKPALAKAGGDKALVGNSGFRRYLKTVSAEHFAVDEARVAEDARFDGLYVLRTNTKLTPLQVMLRYRDLLRVEQLFRQAKAVLATRPIYHSSDMAIRGHVFCSFLALLLVKELEDRLHRHNIAAEWDDILRDLDRLQEIELEQDGKRF